MSLLAVLEKWPKCQLRIFRRKQNSARNIEKQREHVPAERSVRKIKTKYQMICPLSTKSAKVALFWQSIFQILSDGRKPKGFSGDVFRFTDLLSD
jgi:hypothetical protein